MTRLFKLLSFLPLWLLHGIGWLLGWVAFLGSPIYRHRFIENAEQAGLMRRQWLPAVGAAGKLVAELPRLWLGRPVPVQWQGQAYVESALADAKGVLVLTPHLGSFEAMASAYALRYGVSGSPLTVLFRPARKKWIRDCVDNSRAKPGLLTAPTTLAGVKQMLKALKNGQCVALLPDQVPPAGQGLWAPYFGKNAYTMTLSARLAQQTGATVLLAWGQRLAWGLGYVVHIVPFGETLSSDLTTAVAQINRAMEFLVLQSPDQYLWGYARYKQPKE